MKITKMNVFILSTAINIFVLTIVVSDTTQIGTYVQSEPGN